MRQHSARWEHHSRGNAVTSAQQVLGLAAVPTSQDEISAGTDGTSFALPIDGKTNEAVVSPALAKDINCRPGTRPPISAVRQMRR